MEIKSGLNIKIKRFLSALLCVILLLTQDSENLIIAFAASTDTITMKAAYTGTSGESDLAFTGYDSMAKFDFGKTIDVKLYVNGKTPDQSVYVNKVVGTTVSSADESYDNTSFYAPGKYCFNYVYYDSTGEEAGRDESNAYGLEIIKTPLKTPENLAFSDGSVATWSQVSTDRNGNAFINADGNALSATVSYELTLYKDGAQQGTAISVTGTSSATQSYDLSSLMLAGGQGQYTFTVKAICPSTLSAYYADSEASAASSGEKAVKIEVAKSLGMDAVSITTDKSILLAGSSTYGSATLSATPTSGWQFGSWSATDTGVTISGTTTATVTIPSGYTGSTSVTLTARATETGAPTISSVGAGTGDDKGKIVAKVQDSQSGLKAYAFSTNASAPDVWTNLDAATTDEKTFTYTPTASGTYYFYAKDAEGNVSKYSSPIQVSKITYSGYYSNNTKNSSYTEYFIGSSYTLPDLTDTAGNVKRKGYTFGGWYENEDLTGSSVSSLSTNPTSDKTYYAKWDLTPLSWGTTFKDTTVTYTGANIDVAVSITANTADTTYTFYKIAGDSESVAAENTTGKLTLRNVADSGKYKVKASVSYTDDNGLTVQKTITSSIVTITINPAGLTVTANDKTISYKDEIPTFTYKYTGFVGDDLTTPPAVTEGTLTTDYVKGSGVGSYSITFASDFSSANYTVTQVPGTLTVSAKASSAGLTVSLDKASYDYTGEAINPIVTVTDGEDVVDSANYDVDYGSCTTAGTHTLTVNFKKNYTGSLTKDFTINKAKNVEVTVSIDNWTYGETAKTPNVVSGIPAKLTNYTVTFKYISSVVSSVASADAGSETKPENAGNYTLYAVIHDTDGNYQDIISKPYYFTIKQREIHILAGSQEWTYDGNAHSCDSYVFKDAAGNEITADEVFVLSSESFQSITVSGSITDAGTADNTPSYKLTSATKAGNYNIICDKGTLTIKPAKLLSPTNIAWSDDTPGTVEWIAITKQNLNVKYEVRLYEHDGDTGTDTLLTTKTTGEGATSISFIDEIHNDISEGKKKSFYVKVQTIPSSGTASKDYETSDFSDACNQIYSVTIYLSKKRNESDAEDQAGLSTIAFTGDNEGKTSVILIEGESFKLKATSNYGYKISSTSIGTNLYSFVPNNSSFNSYFSESHTISGSSTATGTVTVNSNLTESLTAVSFTACTADKGPQMSDETWENADDLSGVTVSAHLSDELGLKFWGIQSVTKKTRTYTSNDVEYTETYYEAGSNYYRYTFGSGVTSQDVSVKITSPGLYRLFYSDRDGEYWASGNAYEVFEIKFASGDASDSTHTMPTLYKLADTTITLPAVTYEYSGYTFNSWSGANVGIVTDQAEYKANKSDTLVAQWSKKQVSYESGILLYEC